VYLSAFLRFFGSLNRGDRLEACLPPLAFCAVAIRPGFPGGSQGEVTGAPAWVGRKFENRPII